MNAPTLNSNGNGSNRFFGWLMGAFVAPAVVAGSAALTHMVINDNARLAALEKDTEHRLRAIESKLDRLIGRQ
jgi:hypothetical protein